MAKKKLSGKRSKRGTTFRGGRKAERLGRQIERLKEQFPLDQTSAAEWLHYARVMKTTAEVLEIQALMEIDPARFRVLKDAMQARAKAKSEARGEAEENEENEENGDN